MWLLDHLRKIENGTSDMRSRDDLGSKAVAEIRATIKGWEYDDPRWDSLTKDKRRRIRKLARRRTTSVIARTDSRDSTLDQFLRQLDDDLKEKTVAEIRTLTSDWESNHPGWKILEKNPRVDVKKIVSKNLREKAQKKLSITTGITSDTKRWPL